MDRRIAAASLGLALAATGAWAAEPPPRYLDVVLAYSSGERARAVAEVGQLSEDAIDAGVASLAWLPHLARSAMMLHADRRLLERQSRDAVYANTWCQTSHTVPAARAAGVLLLHSPAGAGWARRWYLAMALQDRWQGCFDDALLWGESAARSFPRHAEVLLTLGKVHESMAAVLPESSRAHLGEAQAWLEKAVEADPTLAEAQVRLGRVLWRRGRAADARARLELAIAGSPDEATLHLAHLFLGRVHEDEGRRAAALQEYRAALELEPQSQAAALAVAGALQLEGETAEAREVVQASLSAAGRRRLSQPFWDYHFGSQPQWTRLLDALREEVR